jgi:hypothetical protein
MEEEVVELIANDVPVHGSVAAALNVEQAQQLVALPDETQSGVATAEPAGSLLPVVHPFRGSGHRLVDEAPAVAAEPTANMIATSETPGIMQPNVKMEPSRGYIPLTVRFAPVHTWKQRTVYVNENCNSDDLKWALRSQFGCDVSTLRVHEGFRGTPYDRRTPLTQGPPDQQWTAPNDMPFLVIPSFGP